MRIVKEKMMIEDNVSGKFANLRDAWFSTSERKFTEKLIKNAEFVALVSKLQEAFKPHHLYHIARGFMNKVESGRCKSVEEATEAEIMISACLIRGDKKRVKELVRLPDFEEFYKMLRSSGVRIVGSGSIFESIKFANPKPKKVEDDEIENSQPDQTQTRLGTLSESQQQIGKFFDGRKLAERRNPNTNGGRGGIERN